MSPGRIAKSAAWMTTPTLMRRPPTYREKWRRTGPRIGANSGALTRARSSHRSSVRAAASSNHRWSSRMATSFRRPPQTRVKRRFEAPAERVGSGEGSRAGGQRSSGVKVAPLPRCGDGEDTRPAPRFAREPGRHHALRRTWLPLRRGCGAPAPDLKAIACVESLLDREPRISAAEANGFPAVCRHRKRVTFLRLASPDKVASTLGRRIAS
jgi:hypothetical protein